MPHQVLIAGHRGYFAKEIENTLAAFKRAIREKVHFAEFDIMRTRDNVPIVFHDLMVNRLLNGTGYVRQFTLGELKRLEYKDGQKILTLEEFFQETRGRIRPLLEIKSKGLEAEILSLVRKYDVEKEIIIQSFKVGALRRCMALRPDLAYALNIGPIFKLGFLGDVSRLHKQIARMTYFRMLRHLPVSFIHPDGPFVYNAFIDLARARGKRIMVGAIRTQNYIHKIVDWGIEVLCCNDPGDIREKIKFHWGNEVICD